MPVPGENPALDAETQVPTLIGISVAFIVAAALVVALRIITRMYIVKAVGADDITMVAAVILSVGVTATTILQANYGLGIHAWLVDVPTTMNQLKSLFASEVIYNLSQILSKISILLQYRRIFRDDFTRRLSLGMLLYLIAWGITQEFLVGFACIPVSIFDPSRTGKCIETIIVWYLTSVMNIVTDFIIFLTPMKAIKSLQLRTKQKILVASIFCLGFFACVISIVRLFTLRAAITSTDPTWDNVATAYWSIIELNTAIICASAATLRPLLRRIIPGFTQDRHSYYPENKDGSTGQKSLHSPHSAYHEASVELGVAGGSPPRGQLEAEVYALRDCSQEGLRDNAAYAAAPHARAHGGPVSELRTAIYGGNPQQVSSEESVVVAAAAPREIRVTRETTMRESRGSKA